MFMYYFYFFKKLSIINSYCCQLFAGPFADSDIDKLDLLLRVKNTKLLRVNISTLNVTITIIAT